MSTQTLQTPIDPLQTKIEQAKANLPVETVKAIDAVDWKAVILNLKEKKGFSYEQLWDLEIETELLLYGLTDPKEYPKELVKRMNLPRAQVDLLIAELNELVFKKIRDYLINNGEVKKEEKKPEPIIQKQEPVIQKMEPVIQKIEKRDEMLEKIENPEKIQSISSQKLSSTFQIPTIKTEYSLNNLTKQMTPEEPKLGSTNTPASSPKIDPYRLTPEE